MAIWNDGVREVGIRVAAWCRNRNGTVAGRSLLAAVTTVSQIDQDGSEDNTSETTTDNAEDGPGSYSHYKHKSSSAINQKVNTDHAQLQKSGPTKLTQLAHHDRILIWELISLDHSLDLLFLIFEHYLEKIICKMSARISSEKRASR